ncbi:MAG: hypothetical protein Q8L12_12690 [Methylibium sp.]|nr:hypothetical protein [Methylibium sp.]
MSVLRIFSYLPNPRIAKATIAARLCGVSLEVRGAPVQELQDWLWDFDAHPLSVEERDALRHCVRTGRTGFASALYKTDAFLAAQQAFTIYLSGIERALASGAGFIAGGTLSLADICFAAELALFHNERVHHGQLHRAGLAPILSDGVAADHPLAWAHFGRLCAHEAFAPDLEPYLEAFGKH